MESSYWKRFIISFFGDAFEAWHDGLDITTLHTLTNQEKKKAEQLMLKNIQKNYRTVIGLGELKTLEALPVLKKMLPSSSGQWQVHLAVAINKIEAKNNYTKYIIDILQNDHSEYDRAYAATQLRLFASKKTEDALLKALKDPDYLVRLNAAESLLFLHHVEDDIIFYKELVKNLGSHTTPSQLQKGMRQLKAILRQSSSHL